MSDDPEVLPDWPAGAFLGYHNAACWVAYQSFDHRTTQGPKHISYILDEGDSAIEENAEQEGRYWLAFEQISRALQRGLISAYGRLSHEYLTESEMAKDKPSDVIGDGMVRELKSAEFNSFTTNESNFYVGGHVYQQVAINWLELKTVFGPLAVDIDRVGTEPFPIPITDGKPTIQLEQTNRGRPAKWDWQLINTEIVLLAHSNKLPDTQAKLEIWVAEKCQELFGDEPGVSTIRSKIAPIYLRLRQKSQ